MPYQSDRQRRFMHARHPEIAERWDAEIRAKRHGRLVAKGGPAFLLTGALTGAGGLASAGELHRRGRDDSSREALAGLIGGWGGQGVYQGAGYGAKHYALRRLEPRTTKSQRNKALKPIKARHGAYTAEMERNYPLRLPEAKVHRVLGWTHRGRVGTTVGGLATLAGAAAGAHSVNSRRDVRKLYVKDTQTSPVRVLEAGAGLGLAAWGAGRSRMLGAALGRGVKMAQQRNSAYALEALQRAQAAQGALGRLTAPGERTLRQVRAVDEAINRVPRALRPEIAAAAGTLLVGHAMPIRQSTYHPVNVRIRTRSY